MHKVRCGTYRPSKSVKKMLQDSLKIKLPVTILKKVSVLEQIEQHCSLTIIPFVYTVRDDIPSLDQFKLRLIAYVIPLD